MTIEIRQLIIRASVTAPRAVESTSTTTVAQPQPPEPRHATLAVQRDALISACVREVLRKLERARER